MDTTETTDTNAPNAQAKQAALLKIIDHARALEQTLASFFDDSARAAVGTVEVWAPKDHFAHLAVWQTFRARRLEAISTGNPPEEPESNDEAFQKYRDNTWSDSWAMAMRALDKNATVIARTPEDDLTHPERFPWMNGGSFVSGVVSSGYLHPVEHVTQMYEERGDLAAAERVQLESVAVVSGLFGKGEEYGIAAYNLGCFYAKRGRVDDAIAQVREALAVNPRLTDWSKEDSDLVSLHSLPAYQALYVG